MMPSLGVPGELGVILAARFGAVAPGDEEEVLDHALLDRLDEPVGNGEHGVVSETDLDPLAGVFAEAWQILGAR